MYIPTLRLALIAAVTAAVTSLGGCNVSGKPGALASQPIAYAATCEGCHGALAQASRKVWHIEATYKGSDGPLYYKPGPAHVLAEYANKVTCEAHLQSAEFLESLAALKVTLLLRTGDDEVAESVKAECVEADEE